MTTNNGLQSGSPGGYEFRASHLREYVRMAVATDGTHDSLSIYLSVNEAGIYLDADAIEFSGAEVSMALEVIQDEVNVAQKVWKRGG